MPRWRAETLLWSTHDYMHDYGGISMQRYWSSLLRYCPRDSVSVGCRSSSSSNWSQSTGILGIPLPALLSNISLYLDAAFYRCCPAQRSTGEERIPHALLLIYINKRRWPNALLYMHDYIVLFSRGFPAACCRAEMPRWRAESLLLTSKGLTRFRVALRSNGACMLRTVRKRNVRGYMRIQNKYI